MRSALLAAAAAALTLTASPARAESPRAVTVTPLAGAWVALGQARHDFEDAPLAGLQAALELDPRLAVIGTFSWAGTDAKRLADGGLDLFQYDLGLRGQLPLALGGGATLRPFVGVGVGLRTYSFRSDRHAGGTGFASYGALGAELGYRALTAGLSVRHEVSTPDATALDLETPRQDLALAASVGVRF